MSRRWLYLALLAIPLALYRQVDLLYSAYYWRYSVKFWPLSCAIMLIEILLLYLSTLGLFRRSGINISPYVAIPLGTFLFGSISFFLGFISSLPFVRLFSFLLPISLFLYFRKGNEIHKKDLLPFLYFLTVFFPILLLRAGIPSAYYNYGEALMDLAFVSASIRATSLPLYDPWLSGFHANYYYFGHFMWGSLGMLSFMPPEYCVNFCAALLLAMTFSASYGFLSRVGAKKWISILGAFFITFSGSPYNFSLFLANLFHGSLPTPSHPWKYMGVFWHLSPACLIPGATFHTPAIDFLQREFHENFIAVPYMISYISLISELRREKRGYFWIVPFLGAFFPLDSWVFPILVLYTWLTLGILSIPWTILSALPVLPYYLSLQYRPGIGFIPPSCKVVPPVPIWAFATLFSLALLVLFGYILVRKKGRRVAIALGIAGAIGIASVFTRYHVLLFTLPLLAYFGLRRDEEKSIRFLVFTSVLFITFCEFLFVKDAYSLNGLSKYSRFNTIFKIYEPCWIMLSLASFSLLSRGFEWISKNRIRIMRGVLAASVALALVSMAYFPLAYLGDKYTPYGFASVDANRFSLNAVEYLSNLSAIYYLREMPFGIVVEGVGKSPEFSYSPFGRVSAITGFPTVLGWGGHVAMWRGYEKWILETIAKRYYAILYFYLSPNEQELKELYENYHVKYIFFGKLEREMIRSHGGSPNGSLEAMSSLNGLKTIYSSHGCYVFEVLPSKLFSKTPGG